MYVHLFSFPCTYINNQFLIQFSFLIVGLQFVNLYLLLFLYSDLHMFCCVHILLLPHITPIRLYISTITYLVRAIITTLYYWLPAYVFQVYAFHICTCIVYFIHNININCYYILYFHYQYQYQYCYYNLYLH